jgi:CBS domain containing-hemolysin-like protein
MTDADLLALITVVLCLLGSMFFSGSETAITTGLGEREAHRIIDEGGRNARVASLWAHHPVRVLATILVGNNLVNTLLGSVVTAATLRHLGGGAWGDWAVPIAVALTTAVLLVFGEIVPKAVGRTHARSLALPLLAALDVVSRVLGPLVWFFTMVTGLVLRSLGINDSATLLRPVTPDDLEYLLDVGEREGSVPVDQAAMLRGVLEFDDKVVRDIMVPRAKITAIDVAWDVERIIAVAKATGHSRMPLYERELDEVRGVLHVKQLVGHTEGLDRDSLIRLAREPLFVSESLLIHDLLARFKEERVHLAIVVDDGGQTVGVVTLEDVLEQIVGQIFDETDKAPRSPATSTSDGVVFVDGQDSLRRIEETFDVEFDEFDGVQSIGDLLTQLAGQMPIAGSIFVYEGLRFKVLAANAKKIIRVSVESLDLDDDDDGPSLAV